MSKLTQKIATVSISIATVVSLSGFAAFTPTVQAAALTQSQIDAIVSLLQSFGADATTIANVNASLTGGTPVSSGTPASSSFTRNLTVGSTGSDVSALQQILINGGYLKISAPTGTFASMTKAALAAWQSANGVSPAAGYFGAISRAKIGGGVVGTTTGGVPVVAPATGLQVSLASDNPAVGSLIAGAGRTPVLAFNLTAGVAGPATVTQVKLNKVGVISDTNIAGAYLVRGGAVVAQYTSLSSGVITFSGLSISIPAGQTQEYWLAIDVSTGVTAGNTVGFGINSAANVSATDSSGNAITATGGFPITGTTYTASTVSSPSIATVSFTSSSVGSTVYAGTQGVLVSAWTVSVSNSPVKLSSIKFKVVGSASKTDIQNVKFFVNGTQVGQTLPAVASDGSAYFDLSAANVSLRTGTSNVQVYADVMGSPSFTYQFELLNSYDIYAVDTNYNTSITPTITGGAGVAVTIQQGQTTLSLSTDSPTGNIAKGQSNVTLAKYKIYAAGEAVKVKFLDFSMSFTGVTGTIAGNIKNVSLVDDQGIQVGSTISTPPTANTCTGSAAAAAYSSVGVYTDCFGTSASPINYVIPANTTRVLSMKGDIQSTAAFTNVTAALTSETGKTNLQGLTSSQTGDTGGGVTASALALASSSLTVSQNSSVGTQTVTKNSSGQKIGSYSFAASTAEGVTINNISISVGAAAATNYQNLRVMLGSTQFGITQPTLAASAQYTFSGIPFTIAAGATQIVDVYADVLSGATGTQQASTLSSCTGTGSVSYSTVSCTSVNGQTVTVGGSPALTVSADNAGAPSGQLIMGTTGNSLATFRFQETTGNEAVRITDMNVFQATGSSTARAALGSIYLYQGTNLMGSAGGASSTNANNGTTASDTQGYGFIYKFHFATPVVVPALGSLSLVLKGDIPVWNAGGGNISDKASSSFMIATSSDSGNVTSSSVVTALGNSSSQPAAIAITATTGYTNAAAGNTMTFLRSNLVMSAASLGATSGRGRSLTDDVGTITFTASNGGAISLNQVSVTVAGNLASSTTFMSNTTSSVYDLVLQDPSTGAKISPLYNSTSTPCTNTATCKFTFTFVAYASTTASNAGYTLSAGASKTFNLRIDSLSHTIAPAANIYPSFAAQIGVNSDVTFTDATDGTGVLVNLPATAVPVNVTSVTYAQ